MYNATHLAAYWVDSRGNEHATTCGTYRMGEQVLCDKCRRRAERTFPQGWRGYPGDTCKHGTYVGGCGIDRMCGACEMGD